MKLKKLLTSIVAIALSVVTLLQGVPTNIIRVKAETESTTYTNGQSEEYNRWTGRQSGATVISYIGCSTTQVRHAAYLYDTEGRVREVSDVNYRVQYSYNDIGQLTERGLSVGNTNITEDTYTYKTYMRNGTTYVSNQLTKIEGDTWNARPARTSTYDNNGYVTGISYNGDTYAYSYDGLGRLVSETKNGEMPVNEIKRHDIQVFLFGFVDAGKPRTAQKLKIMLKEIFDMLNEDYDLKTPMKKIVLAHHEAKKGRAFSKEEEKRIIDFCKENPHFYGNSALLLLMYTGMRVGEMPSHWIEGEFICCVSEKIRKGYNEVVRRIPMSPMLKKVLPLIDFEATKVMSRFTVRDALKRIFPDRHVHEFRYTFITRAKECGVNPEVVMLWAGHEFDHNVKTSRVDRGYTTYSDEYFLKEINKIDYEL